MPSRLHTTIVVPALLIASLAVPAADTPSSRALLIEARDLAYDANYRNDQASLRSAIATLQPLTKVPEEAAYAHYYLSWTYWMLTASQVTEKDVVAGLESARLAVDHARAGVALRDRDPEFHTMLANALVVVGILDRAGFEKVWAELDKVRRRAVELGPDNPRVLIMDAAMIFWSPPERGGSRDGGLARWKAALRQFEAEAHAKTVDPVVPRWGHALTYGWTANWYLSMTPPQKDNARQAAETALRMRPDFWYVRDQLMPRLRE